MKYTLLPLFILMVAASYWRFFVLHDNLVSYEAACDPAVDSCYVLCEDETISDLSNCPSDSLFYYALIERYAADLVTFCGDTVVDCEFADACMENETSCTIYFCDPTEGDVCTTTEATMVEKELQVTVNNEI